MSSGFSEDRQYDWVFISHLPSFYKINLFNKIAESAKVLAIFLGETSQERTADFVKGDKQFDYVFLNTGDFERRGRWGSSWRLVRLLLKLKYKRLSVGGWDLPESWVAILCSPKNKNVITQESSIFESKISGAKSLLKRLFVKRLGMALVSGLPHARLMRAVGFAAEVAVTGGVGLANRAQRPQSVHKEFSGHFLYIGRLSPEKNLAFLLRAFASPEMRAFHLTLVGNGSEREALRSLAGGNVTFLGHVPNEEIHKIYEAHDAFILPSVSEPWGLVVEEALYYGLPVLASAKVGSVEDLVLGYGAGLVFDPCSEGSLRQAIETVATQYEHYARAAREIDFDDRDNKQVRVYVDAASGRGAK
ncbi:MAG TPA: glycosyltransferase [Sideroxyarcus sp.]|nr:glycosyltransferase [Sideroxyarcus sp.]